MTNKKLEKILELLVNENTQQAEDLLHEFMVEKARAIYEEIVSEEDKDMDFEMGGEADEDFTAEIEADADEIETDEINDGVVDDEVDHEELEIDDRVSDLESELEALRAEFDALMAEELEEPNHADLADAMDSDEEVEAEDDDEFKESVYEETKFLKAVSKQLDVDGADAAAKKAPLSTAPKKRVGGANPVDFTKGKAGEMGKYHGEHADDETMTDNIGVTGKVAPKVKSKPTHDDKSAASTLTKVSEARKRK